MKTIVKILIITILSIARGALYGQCDFIGTANVSSTGFENTAGFTQDYFIVDSETGLIVSINSTGSFTVNSGEYTVHAVNYEGSRPSEVAVGESLTDVQNYEGNTANCFDMISRSIIVCEEQCLDDANISVSAKNFKSGDGFNQIYCLVNLATNFIVSSNTTGDFPTFVFSAADLYKVYAVNTNDIQILTEINSLSLWSVIEGLLSSSCLNIIGPKYIDVIDCPSPLSSINLNLKGEKVSEFNDLQWTYEEDIELDYFNIYKSDGNSAFQKIARTIEPHYNDYDIGALNYYKVELVTKSSDVGVFSNSVSLEREDDFDGMSLYPNPVNDKLEILFKTKELNVNVSILNSIGEIVSQRTYVTSSGQNKVEVNVSDLANGIYFVQLGLKGIYESKRFIKL